MTQETLFTKSVFSNQLEVRTRKVKIAECEEKYFSKIIHGPESIYELCKSVFKDSPCELFVVFHLKSNNQLSAYEIITKGILNSSLVHPREVFRSAIMRNAASIIIAHNHPSGNSEPSEEDLKITKQIVAAGKILGITVLDHVIFTEEVYYSFAECGTI